MFVAQGMNRYLVSVTPSMPLKALLRGWPARKSLPGADSRKKKKLMLKNATPLADELEKQTIPTDTPKLPKHSQWDNLVLTLKLIGIALAILGAIWGIEYLKNH
jgi:hypothetical protein